MIDFEFLLPNILALTCKILVCELSLQEVADCLKAPVRMIGETRPVLGVSFKLVQKQERIEVPELLNKTMTTSNPLQNKVLLASLPMLLLTLAPFPSDCQ